MTEKITDKSTKATILSAYKEAQKEIRRLQREKPQQTSDAVKVEKPELYTAEAIARDIAAIKNNFVYGFNELESQLIKRTDQLTVLESEIIAQEAKLAEVHEITREADTLAALKYACETERADHQQTLSERQASFDEQMKDQRTKWQREKEEYEYERDKQRAREKEEGERAQEELERNIAERQGEFERSIEERLVKLDQREAVCEKLEEEIESIQEKHADEISTEVQRAILATEASSKHEYETETRLLDQKVNSLTEVIGALRTENKELKEELKAINKMANEVAQQAVQSNKVIHLSEKQA